MMAAQCVLAWVVERVTSLLGIRSLFPMAMWPTTTGTAHVLVADCPGCKALLKALGTSEANDGVVDEELHTRLHREMNKPWDQRAAILTTNAAAPQPKPAGA
jgi:hypothetical protein